MCSLPPLSSRRRGFVFMQLLAGLLVAAVLAGTVGYLYVNAAKSNAAAQARTQSGGLLQQALYTLATESSDSDSDGFAETTAGSVAYSGAQAAGITDGWNIPTSSGAPKTDAWGSNIKYCAWDNGATNSSTGRISGDNPATQSSIVMAVISAGVDKVIQTSCASVKNSLATPPTDTAPKGDDGMRTMTVAQLVQGVGGTAYLGDPVTTASVLAGLPASALKPGQLRVAKDTGITYVNATGCSGASCWTQLAGNGGSGGITSAANYASLPASCTQGQLGATTNNNYLYVCNGGTWQVATSTSVSSTLAVSTTTAQVTGSTGAALPSTTAFTVSGGTAPYSYSLNGSLPSPVVADTSTNSSYKLTSNGTALSNVALSNAYTVTVTDSVGFSKTVALTVSVVANTDGYANRGYATPAVAGPPPASCPDGFVGVPSMQIPTDASGGALVVAAFCVQQYPAAMYSGVLRTASPSTSAWYNAAPAGGANGVLFADAQNGCNSILDGQGYSVSGAHLIRESQWLAIAHNLVMQGSNWTNGNIGLVGGTNAMYEGLSDSSTAGPVAASYVTPTGQNSKRGKVLTTGAIIYDIGGNTEQWTYLDANFGLGGNGAGVVGTSTLSPGLMAAPFAPLTRGMGQFTSNPNNNMMGMALVHGYNYNSGNSAGPFALNFYNPSNATAGARCAI